MNLPSFKIFKLLHPSPRLKRLDQLQQTAGEISYLAGRNSRSKELLRLIRISFEFLRGMRALHRLGPTISVFGSARFREGHPYYDLGVTMGKALALEGFTVMTGGGPGIMEAANRGAQAAGGPSIGCNIILPNEQAPNGYLDRVVTFYYFFVRKIMLIKYSYGFVILPGGLGTMDELFEAITLIQTGKLYDFPVILMGVDYWKGLYEWILNTLVKNGAVAPQDLKFIHLTDDPKKALEIINRTCTSVGVVRHPLNSTAS